MSKTPTGSPIPRHYLFVLRDGTVVVQWVAHKVQEITTGVFRPYTGVDYGHAVTNEELDWLVAHQHVSHYTPRYVWLLPIARSEGTAAGGTAHRVRAFYIMTVLTAGRFAEVEQVLAGLPGLPETQVRVHDEKVAVYSVASKPFRTLQDAEFVLKALQGAAPETFHGAFVAVFEMALGRQAADDNDLEGALWPGMGQLPQTDTTVTAQKTVVMVGADHPDQKDALARMFSEEMGMSVVRCEAARQAIPLLEDNPPTLAVVDLNLPDSHGWTLIRNVREIRSLANQTFLVLSDNPNDEVFALKVAKVAGFFAYPLDLRALREKVWLVLRDVEVGNAG